jgi:two-component system sensor histidine kinase UhpB
MTSSDLAFTLSPSRGERATTVLSLRAVRERALRAPLVAKLLGANLLIALVAVAATTSGGHPALIGLILAVLCLSVGINALLVRLALSPLDELQYVAERVSHGEGYLRAGKSEIADRRIERLGATFNQLLDTVQSDHVHIHQLIRRGLAARETERSVLSHELREVVAQQLTAIALQLAVAEGAFGRGPGLSALRASRELSVRTVEQVQHLADSIYPGLLHELGLRTSLAALASRTARRSAMRISADATGVPEHLSPALVTAMFHVAEEAVRNAECHSGARSVRIRLTASDGVLRLEVGDDGRGFDVAAAERSGRGAGLFEARELLASVHGELRVKSSPLGTLVIGTARLDQGDTC